MKVTQRLFAQGRCRYMRMLVQILAVELLKRNRWLPFYRRLHALNVSLYSFV
jgi:hypothetical protein